MSRTRLATLARRGLVRPVLRGVYAAAQVVDTIEFRAAALALVVPPTAIVTDRTAAWLHMVDVLAPSAVHRDASGGDLLAGREPAASSGCRERGAQDA